jgi:hypothetical protein
MTVGVELVEQFHGIEFRIGQHVPFLLSTNA